MFIRVKDYLIDALAIQYVHIQHNQYSKKVLRLHDSIKDHFIQCSTKSEAEAYLIVLQEMLCNDFKENTLSKNVIMQTRVKLDKLNNNEW